MSTRAFSRRSLLAGAAATGLTLPFLPSLRTARAGGLPPKRLLAIVMQQGHRESGFLPSGEGMGVALPPVLEPLAPYADRVSVLHGLEGFADGHDNGTAAALCEGWFVTDTIYVRGEEVPTPREYFDAYTMGPSIDQLVAQRFGGETSIPSLQLGMQTAHGGHVSFAGPLLPIPPVEHPAAAFDRLAGYSLGDPAQAAALREQSLWVVDAVKRNFEATNARLAASERRVVDAHLTMLHEHEARLRSATAPVTCDFGTGPDVAPDADFRAHSRAQLENAIVALRCDVTRVVSIAWGKGESNYSFPWLGIEDSWHDPIAHGNGTNYVEKQNAIKRWHYEELAEVCRRLDEIPDGEGTLLDNTLIVVADELQVTDYMPSSHGRANMPGVIIGDAQGFLRPGQAHGLRGRPYGDFLFTVGHAMGLTDLATFGARGGPAENAPPPAALIEELLA
jgi:hypothetical protein